ncbi:hypothetical protein P8452_67406 [Trifolium repens]|nr:hypothetical protein P8452_67406 [Trifolium repens]
MFGVLKNIYPHTPHHKQHKALKQRVASKIKYNQSTKRFQFLTLSNVGLFIKQPTGVGNVRGFHYSMSYFASWICISWF